MRGQPGAGTVVTFTSVTGARASRQFHDWNISDRPTGTNGIATLTVDDGTVAQAIRYAGQKACPAVRCSSRRTATARPRRSSRVRPATISGDSRHRRATAPSVRVPTVHNPVAGTVVTSPSDPGSTVAKLDVGTTVTVSRILTASRLRRGRSALAQPYTMNASSRTVRKSGAVHRDRGRTVPPGQSHGAGTTVEAVGLPVLIPPSVKVTRRGQPSPGTVVTLSIVNTGSRANSSRRARR